LLMCKVDLALLRDVVEGRRGEEGEEQGNLINDLRGHAQLAAAYRRRVTSKE